MMPLGCSGCGHDRVKLFMVELIWCIMGTMEGAAKWVRKGKQTVSAVNDKKRLVLRTNSLAKHVSQNSITGSKQDAQKTTAVVPVSRSPDQETDQSQQHRGIHFSRLNWWFKVYLM